MPTPPDCCVECTLAPTTWDVPIATGEDPTEDVLLLADLAETTAGVALETVGQAENLTVLTPEQREATRAKIAAKYA